MKIGNISVYPMININPTLQKRLGQRWSMLIGIENLIQRKNKIRTESKGYNRITYSKSHLNVKAGVTYTFNSGKKFQSPRIEKNIDNSRIFI